MKNKVILFLKTYTFPLISGVLIGTSYIPFPPWALFFCMAPLWHFCLKHPKNLKKLFFAGWICQFTLTLIGFHWTAYTIHVFGHLPWTTAVFLFLLFCALAHLHIPFSLLLWSFLIRIKPFQNEAGAWLLLPVTSAVSFSFLPMIFKWHLGYPWLYGKWPAFQTAELWGFDFLSTLTLFLQLCFLALRKKGRFKILFPIGIAVFSALNILGFILEKRLNFTEKKATVLMVQHNTGSMRSALGPRYLAAKRVSNRLIRASEKALKNHPLPVDFILWPEGAYPYTLFETKKDSRTLFLKKIVKNRFKTYLITGAGGRSPAGASNSIFFINKEGRFHPSRYDKHHLLAFGEFIPGEKWFPKLREYFLGGSTPFIKGKGPAVFDIDGRRLGVQICYESLFADFSRTLAQKKADLFVNITNDSWFGRPFEPYQHLYMSLARGIENRKPVIRLTNTGISTAITAKGDLLSPLSPIGKKWSKVLDVPYWEKPFLTLFARWGFYINAGFILIVIIGLVVFGLIVNPARKNRS